jgi:hypothetical protein
VIADDCSCYNLHIQAPYFFAVILNFVHDQQTME